MRLNLVVAAALAAATALVGSACGSSEPPAAARVAACDLIARGDVGEVLQAPMEAPVASDDSATDALAGRSGCAWTTTDHAKAVLVELVRTRDMAAQVRRTGFSAAARFQAASSAAPAGDSVPGVGDRALWVDEAATLHVIAGGSYLTIEVATTPPSAAEPTATALARLAIARLERIDRAD